MLPAQMVAQVMIVRFSHRFVPWTKNAAGKASCSKAGDRLLRSLADHPQVLISVVDVYDFMYLQYYSGGEITIVRYMW